MFNSKALLASTLAAVLVSFAAAAPAIKPSPDASVTVEVCSGSVNPANGCVTVPVVSDSCNDLTGGLSFLNKEISWAVVPGGFICTFFQDFGCIATGTGNAPTDSSVVLQQGTWDMFSVPGLSGTTNFNDLTSSFSCSPL